MFKMRFIFIVFCFLLLVSCSAEPDVSPATSTAAATTAATATVPAAATPTPTLPPTATDAADEPEPVAEIDRFLDELSAAVAARDFETLSSQMSFPFALGAWRAEWSTYASSNEVQTFFDTYYAAAQSQEFHPLTVVDATELLGGQDAAALFGPDVQIAGFVHSTGWGDSGTQEALLIVVEEDGRFSWQGFLYTNGPFVRPQLEVAEPPAGLIYRDAGAIYQIQSNGQPFQLYYAAMASAQNFLISPDGRFAVYNDDARNLWLVDAATLGQEQIGGGNLAAILNWGSPDVLFVGTWLNDGEAEGPNNGHLTLNNVAVREAVILDEEHLSAYRPAYSPADDRVAFDVIPGEGETLNGRIYDPTNGLQTFDPSDFTTSGQAVEAPVMNPAWSPDGSQLTWLRPAGERTYLQLFDLEANTAVTLFDWDPARFGALVPSPKFSPDGQWLALEVWANGLDGSGIWLVAADGSSQRLIDAEGHDPLWLSESQLGFGANGQPFLYDVTAEQTFKLDLPEGSWLVGLATEDAVGPAAESNSSAVEISQVGLPDPETLTSTVEQFTSPDGRWQATVVQTEPVATDDGDKFFTSLTVTDGTTTWQPIAEWRGYGLGLAYPALYRWSADGRSLYFTNKIAADGCTLFANATDLYRLNLAEGVVDTILDTGLTWNIGLSPDETKLAYTFSSGQGIVLEVLDLFNGTQGSVTVVEDSVALQAGAIVWSPDGTQLALTVAHDPCSQNWMHSIVQVDVITLTAVSILEKDAQRLVTTEWSDQQRIRLVDNENNNWVLNLDSGDLTPEN